MPVLASACPARYASGSTGRPRPARPPPPCTTPATMIDATYFRTRLAADVKDFAQPPIVELHLTNRQLHRLRGVLEVQEGYLIVEAYRTRTEESLAKRDEAEETFGGASKSEVERAIVAYESVAQVIITPSKPAGSPRIGFGYAR